MYFIPSSKLYGIPSSITKLEVFEDDAKVIHAELNEKSIIRDEKGLKHTIEKFNELREVIRMHRTKTDLTHEKVIKLETVADLTRDDVKSIKNLLIEMNKNKLIEMNKRGQ